MIKFERTEVMGWEAAIRGMRNPMNSWGKSDSLFCPKDQSVKCEKCKNYEYCGSNYRKSDGMYLEENDLDLMKRLRNAGTDHRKFMRMITVYVDITAPLYWWKEFDTYKVGTVVNSCSTMHKIADKEFTLDDFSHEHLITREKPLYEGGEDATEPPNSVWLMNRTIQTLNQYRDLYLQTKDKKYWWQMIQLLPSSYNQKRTVMMNYEVLANIYKSRKSHKLDEWAEHNSLLKKEDDDIPGVTVLNHEKEPYFGFCDWLKTLPYSELIAGDVD